MNTDPLPANRLRAAPAIALPGIWRGSELGRQSAAVVPTGWPRLDRELPGGGWPSQSLTEVLVSQPAAIEWRLLSPALRQVVARGGHIAAVAPPHPPYLPGLRQAGLDERRFVWIEAQTPAERLWTTEQLIKARACGAVIAWLPQARPEQIRRLQVCAQSFEGLVFLCRPEAARRDSSAAPLRVHAGFGLDWELRLHILKRRGPMMDGMIALASMPDGLARVITPQLLRPSRLFSREVPADAVGGPVTALRARRDAAIQ
ncbi:translesion DNA synthesis-associated protein ImuA [Bordetella sp. FB-8]|uniref:translesion DNA synthesis-associated protein ImuA n=1 Tax=Bordetella sp. FB-8 TaxID=1159870 RepID=UPI0003658093|nr:translesion DNA synthesis-associated protein ImuA [Bordetella sp. FB-8]